jgi:hypothetical protein
MNSEGYTHDRYYNEPNERARSSLYPNPHVEFPEEREIYRSMEYVARGSARHGPNNGNDHYDHSYDRHEPEQQYHSPRRVMDFRSGSERFVSKDIQFQSPPPLDQTPKMVEISPGVHERLRGADETLNAVKLDFYMPTECFCCSLTIFCIQDAEYILCPDCRVVSPVPGDVGDGLNSGGVGLGFTMEDLAEWQDDIMRSSIREQRRQEIGASQNHGYTHRR